MTSPRTAYNKTPRRFRTTRTLEGDYVYRGIKITVLREHSFGVIYPNGHKKKYESVRAAQEGITQYFRHNKETGDGQE